MPPTTPRNEAPASTIGPTAEPPLLRIREVAALLGMSESSVRLLIREGEIKPVPRVGSRDSVRIHRRELDPWLGPWSPPPAPASPAASAARAAPEVPERRYEAVRYDDGHLDTRGRPRREVLDDLRAQGREEEADRLALEWGFREPHDHEPHHPSESGYPPDELVRKHAFERSVAAKRRAGTLRDDEPHSWSESCSGLAAADLERIHVNRRAREQGPQL